MATPIVAPVRRAILSASSCPTKSSLPTTTIRHISSICNASSGTISRPSRIHTLIAPSTRHLSTLPAESVPSIPETSPLLPALRFKSQDPIPQSLLAQLPLLQLQSVSPASPGLYATLHFHARPYLVTVGDKIRLPFLMPNVSAGDVLRLTCASTLGTRDYTLRGTPYVDERLFVARVVVAGVESEPLRVMEKTKRRQRKIKHVYSKHRYTEVFVKELRVRSLGELLEDGVVRKLEDGSLS